VDSAGPAITAMQKKNTSVFSFAMNVFSFCMDGLLLTNVYKYYLKGEKCRKEKEEKMSC
jgi:hypothetical protein